MRERAGLAQSGETAVGSSGDESAADKKALTPCTEIIRRYELLRYNLYKEKYEKNVKHGV